ncbi:MAG TPA: hypothetical protein VG900_08085 [Hyphomicrobiaceae bacterium]|nr:hypothetical protein [Hyphomicrobiaceae bacterium]
MRTIVLAATAIGLALTFAAPVTAAESKPRVAKKQKAAPKAATPLEAAFPGCPAWCQHEPSSRRKCYRELVFCP